MNVQGDGHNLGTVSKTPQLKMSATISKKRRIEDGIRGKTSRPKKRVRKQLEYHSSSSEASDHEENETGSHTEGSKQKPIPGVRKSNKDDFMSSSDAGSASEDASSQSEDDEDEDHDTESLASSTRKQKHVSKRHDPDAFSNSISKILSTKLPQSTRKDPVLSRSRAAAAYSSELADERLEKRAKDKLKADKREDLERGRIKDVLGLESGRAGEKADEEKRLRKIAQRGVVKLFNAVRAAQVKADEARKEERKKGTVGLDQKTERVNEVSKHEFLKLIGGAKGQEKMIEEA